MSKIREFFSPIDMTEGAPGKRITQFAVPMLIGNIAQQLYSTVDSVVVGKYVGDNALAAVGSASPIINLLFVLFIGISTGASIVVSQYVGAKEREKLSRSIGTALMLTVLVSVFIMIVGPVITMPLLRLLKTPDTIIDWCREYLVILFLGFLGLAMYNILCGILRGLGDSFSALLYLLIACVLNIFLDLWFVQFMGVAGVALATILAQFISAFLCLLKVRKMREYFDLEWKYFRPAGKLTKDIVRLGLPSGLTQMVFSLAMVVVQSLTNSFGEMVIASNVIIMRIDGFVMMPNFSFSAAMTTFVGQNLGARKKQRILDGTKQGTMITAAVSTTLVLLIFFFGKYIMMLFTGTEELILLSNRFMRILCAGYIAVGLTQALQGAMRGAGDTITPMWISVLTTVVIRVPIAYLIASLTRSEAYPTGRYECLPVSLLISWILGALITFICYRKGRWLKLIRSIGEEE